VLGISADDADKLFGLRELNVNRHFQRVYVI